MTDTPARYRRRPAMVDAVQWLDTNAAALEAFAGTRFMAIDPEDRDDPDATAGFRESVHECWSLLRPGYWVVKRGDEDFAVLRPEEFADLYEPVAGDPVRREQIRRALAEADGFDYEHLEPLDYQRHADAILALPAPVLPAPADRAAVLREASIAVRRKVVHDGEDFCNGIDFAADLLCRMADEAQQGGELR